MSTTRALPSRTLSLPPRIGIIIIPTDPFWIQVREAILHTNQTLGDEVVILQPAISNSALHSIPPEELVDLVLAQELDALICAVGSVHLLKAMSEEKLRVVCLDEIELQHPLLTVTGSLYEGGKIAGEYISQRLPGKGHAVCITAGQEKIEIAGQSRLAGFFDALRPHTHVTRDHIRAFWRYDEAYPFLLDALKEYPQQIDAIFGVSDTLILAARDAGRKVGAINDDTVLVGLNGDPLALAAIAEGSLAATVDTGAADIGSRAMKLAHEAALGMPLPPILYHQFRLITQKNVASVATRKLIAIADIPTHMVGYSRQEEKERLSQLEISTEITRQIGSLGARDRVVEIIADAVRRHYGYDWVRILRWSKNDDALTLFGGDLSPASQRVPLDRDSLLHHAFDSNQIVLIQDTHNSHRWQIEKEFELVRSRALLPIELGSTVIGVLDLQSALPVRQPSLEIVGLKLLASQLGIAIQNFELYREAVQAREAAEKANQLKTRLIANVGHEMRTPLNTILGFSQSIEKQVERDRVVPAESLSRDIKHIYKSGEHLMYMINDLLDLSRAEIGALSLYFEPLEPVPLLEEVFWHFAQSEPISPLVQWNLQIPKRLPHIRADAVRLRQVLINLLVNARKFTRAGSITLGAAVEPPYLHLCVRDTGQGIGIERQEKIFEPFSTTEQSRRPEGLGLGLSITRHLVALHGGTITLESQPGTGSTFNIYLPLPGVAQEPVRATASGDLNMMLVVSTQSDIPEEVREICERQDLVPVLVTGRHDLQNALAGGKPCAIAWDLTHATSKEWSLIYRIGSNQECAALPFLLFGAPHQEAERAPGLTHVVFKPCPANTLQAWIGQFGADHQSTRSILIVDDDPECRRYYQKLLGNSISRRRVILAEGGKEALEILKEETPALILLDLLMPGVDGFDVLESVRGNTRTHGVPVIIISGKLLNFEDIQRLNHFKTLFATKDILSARETADFLDQLTGETEMLAQPTSMLIKQALGYLHQNFAQPIKRKDVAGAVGVNPNYLNRIFRQEMKLSPLDYLNRLRIRKAKELLCHSQETVTNIATQVGFDDAAYFSRVFHRVTGQSPQQFRQSN